jgi:hypothetical protein
MRTRTLSVKSTAIITLLVLLLLALLYSAQASGTDSRGDPEQVNLAGTAFLPLITTSGREFYMSPSGNDSNSGTTPNAPWATFDKAWTVLQPGDVLTLMDGVYYQSFNPNITGEPGKPITVRAQNDGQAVIDGQGVRIPVTFAYHIVSYYFILEGIVARNSSGSVYLIHGAHNVLKRVSGYDANTDTNDHVFVITGDNNLIEDCVASGTGRKMVLVFEAEHNVIRRCFTDWQESDGRDYPGCWPSGEGLEFYGANYNIIENSISYANTPWSGISVMAQYPQTAIGNKILGSMAIYSGMQHNGVPMVWGDTRPQPSVGTCMTQFDSWPSLLAGFRIGESGEVRDNLHQDIFAWGSARYGLTFYQIGTAGVFSNNVVNRATIINNGLDNIALWGGIGVDARETELQRFDSIQNSEIGVIWTDTGYTSLNGEGARLTNRYVNGVLTNEPLWPWPMEDRIQAELGYSVTDIMTAIIFGSQ